MQMEGFAPPSHMTRLALLISLIAVPLAACDCGSGALVTSGDKQPSPGPQQPAPTTPVVTTPAGWCGGDCDCPTGTRCISTGGELTGNSCQAGMNTCDRPCAVTCGAGTTCQLGVCATAPCLDPTQCSTTPMNPPGGVTVTGTYHTAYELDVHEFADKAATIGALLDVLSAALMGNAQCGSQSTPQGQLICLAVTLIAQNIHAPPWVAQLIQVLAGVFRFGDAPVLAKGTMQLVENANTTITAAESWSEMWMVYNGVSYNVMNSPTLGTNGQITVTVKAFTGTRTTNEVNLGPRKIEFDVNKLLVNLINVAISAGSNNQAHDVGELLDLVLCAQIATVSPANYLLCKTAANQLAQTFELDSGLGGITLVDQKGLIYDDDNDGKADGFGRSNPTTARGSVRGEMSNGLVSGDLGVFPKSNWYGVK